MALPLTMAAALDLLKAEVTIPDSSKKAIASTALDALRHAIRGPNAHANLPSKEEALLTDIRPYLMTLHVFARTAAIARGHQTPGDHEGRAHRFVESIAGRRYDRERNRRGIVPDAWQPLVAHRNVSGVMGRMALLHNCCVLLGATDAPRVMPSYDAFVEAATTLHAEAGSQRAKDALSTYRTARTRLLNERPELAHQFAPVAPRLSSRVTHLGVEPETAELLRNMGYDVATMRPEEMFRALTPGLAADYDWFCDPEGPGKELSDSYKEQCLATLCRVTGWIVRAGRGAELREMEGLDALLVRDVESTSAAQLNPRLAQRLGKSSAKGLVSLLEACAEREAAASLGRSTVVAAEFARQASTFEKPPFTHAIRQNCSRIWAMVDAVYADLGTQGGEHAARWALIRARWGRLQKELASRGIPSEQRVNRKDKLRMMRTVTLPQLMCVGMPLRRRAIRFLRTTWTAARAAAERAGHVPDEHPAVRKAAHAYFTAAVPHCVLAMAVDDGLRRKQYMRGRLGARGNFRLVLKQEDDGTPTGIERVTTWWTGRREDPAHGKIREKRRELFRREDRIVRPGVVDHEILWDVVRYWRPAQLVQAGVFTTIAEYDLGQDLQDGRYVLFPSADPRVTRTDRSRTDISDMAGRELHAIVRDYLRPEVPAWEDLDEEWRSLWAIHIARLLITSYWGGVRQDWETAKYLTADEETTLRESYSEIDAGLRDRMGLDQSNWEQLRAYDPWMDRLYWRQEVFDPILEPDLPLPEHLRPMAEALRAINDGRRKPPKSVVPRIRSARPGQAPPMRRR